MAVRYTVQKSRPSAKVDVKDQGHRGKRKNTESSALTVHSRVFAVGRTQQAATDDTIAWPPGGDGLRRWEKRRMLSSLSVCLFVCQHDGFRTIRSKMMKLGG